MAAAVQAASAVEVLADLAAAPAAGAVQDADSRLFAEINKLENLDIKILEFFCYDTRSCYVSFVAYTCNKKRAEVPETDNLAQNIYINSEIIAFSWF